MKKFAAALVLAAAISLPSLAAARVSPWGGLVAWVSRFHGTLSGSK